MNLLDDNDLGLRRVLSNIMKDIPILRQVWEMVQILAAQTVNRARMVGPQRLVLDC